MCSADKSKAPGLDVTDTVPVDHPEGNRKGGACYSGTFRRTGSVRYSLLERQWGGIYYFVSCKFSFLKKKGSVRIS